MKIVVLIVVQLGEIALKTRFQSLINNFYEKLCAVRILLFQDNFIYFDMQKCILLRESCLFIRKTRIKIFFFCNEYLIGKKHSTKQLLKLKNQQFYGGV